jgi:hypothetical protein
MSPDRPPRSDLAKLVAADPDIARIFADARSEPIDRENPWPAYERFKRRLSRVVGWDSPKAHLATPEAYELAMRELTKALGI